MGAYSTSQFLGAFVGGALGGIALGRLGTARRVRCGRGADPAVVAAGGAGRPADGGRAADGRRRRLSSRRGHAPGDCNTRRARPNHGRLRLRSAAPPGNAPMAHDIIALIAQYGLLLVFFNVLVEQAGVPVPAVPTLIVAGALAAGGKLPLAGVVLVARAGLPAQRPGSGIWPGAASVPA